MILVDVNSPKFNYPAPWDKFVKVADALWSERFRHAEWRDFLDAQLLDMGAVNIMNTYYIEFKDRSDALAFILKFGGIYEDRELTPDDDGSV